LGCNPQKNKKNFLKKGLHSFTLRINFKFSLLTFKNPKE